MALNSTPVVVFLAIILAYFASEKMKDSSGAHEYIPERIARFLNIEPRSVPSHSAKVSNQNPTSKSSKNSKGTRLFTKNQLWKFYRGGDGSKGLYLAILGRVYDVSKGAAHYGPGGGYDFFAGRDGTRAFTTGDFTEKGLTDDLTGVTLNDYDGYKNWMDFYEKDYKFVGKLVGRFYDENGNPTAALKEAEGFMIEAQKEKDLKAENDKKLPPCNSEWTQEKGSRVWCTKLSGGIDRDWVGVPRLHHPPGESRAHCVCVRDTGPPMMEHSSNKDNNRGDLNYPYLREYKNCDPKANSCKVEK